MGHNGDSGDARQKGWCIHCGAVLGRARTRDHVPTRALLDKPYASDLPVVDVCRKCNGGFSKDEQYFVALLGCILSGSAAIDEQSDPRTALMLRQNPGLRERIARSRRLETSAAGHTVVSWSCEVSRLERVLVKNARGHVLFECNEPVFSEPLRVCIATLESMSDLERWEFELLSDTFTTQLESDAGLALLPEVGSRAMMRAFSSKDADQGWVVVQQGVYRYAVKQRGTVTTVRSVLREHIATEVTWQELYE